MKSSKWSQLFCKNDVGFAILKVQFQALNIVDFFFVDINETMLAFFGLKKAHILRKSARTIFQNSLNDWELWKRFCEVVNTKNQKEYEGYSSFLNLNYFVKAFSLEKNKVIILFHEIGKNKVNDQIVGSNYQKNNEMTWVVNTDYQISYANAGVLALLGYTVDEIKQKSIFNLISLSSIESFMRLFEEEDFDKKSTMSVNLEVEMVHKNQNLLLTSHKISYLLNYEGQISGIIGHVKALNNLPYEKNQIANNEEYLTMILNGTAEAIFVISSDGKIKFCNLSCLQILGFKNNYELVGKDAHLLMHHHNAFNQVIPLEECAIHQIFKTGKGVYSDKEVFWRKDQTCFTIEYYAYPLFQKDKIDGVVVTFFDITDRKYIEKQLKESVRSHSILLANLPGMAYKCCFDREWTMQFISDGCYELTGHRPETLLNNRDLSFNDLIAPEYQEHLWQVWVAAVKNRVPIREEYIIITATGQRKWVLEQGQPIFNETGVVESLEGLILDISEQKVKQLEIQYMSQHDVLTGLFNRAYFDKERLRLDNPQYLPLSIIIGDINGLKLTNDAFGHDEGDRLIQKTADIIRLSVRDDDVVARTGGDEFTVLLPNTDSETAYYYLKKIQARCEKDRIDLMGKGTMISLSLGFATKESITENINYIQKTAEDFMYKRKLLERSSLHSSFISSITATMFEKSQETEEHAERMRILSIKVGKKLGLHQKDLDELALLATLHDIGKVSIDRNILNKPDKLTDLEWVEIKKHPEIGYRITKASPELSSIADYVLSHHERWDGKGYPQGLKGQDIPLLSRIISIVDAYDAMTNTRFYRTTKSVEEALLEIKENAGHQFDPNLAILFVEMMEEKMKK